MSSSEELATRFMRVVWSLTRFTHLEQLDNAVASLNLNQLRSLRMIMDEPGITQKDVAERLNITQASVSVGIRHLESLDLVRRIPDESDGRIMRLHLGNQAQQLVNTIEERQTARIIELLQVLPIERQRLIVESLEEALSKSHDS